jgi:hypothetical protein
MNQTMFSFNYSIGFTGLRIIHINQANALLVLTMFSVQEISTPGDHFVF